MFKLNATIDDYYAGKKYKYQKNKFVVLEKGYVHQLKQTGKSLGPKKLPHLSHISLQLFTLSLTLRLSQI